MVGLFLIWGSLRNPWALLPVRCPRHKVGPIRPQSSQALNEGLTKARPQHEEVVPSVCVRCVVVEREKSKCRQAAEHPCLGFGGGLDGGIWPRMRRGGYIGKLDSRVSCPDGSKSFCSGFGLFCRSLIAPALKQWLEQNVFSDAHAAVIMAFRDVMGTLCSAIWSRSASSLVQACRGRSTGLIAGVSLQWAEPEIRREKSRRAAQPRLEFSQPFGKHQAPHRVVAMA